MSTPTEIRVPWRAGRYNAGYIPPKISVTVEPGSAGSTPTVLLADISEFQPEINDAAYLAWSKAIIIRAMYGDAHDDKSWFGGQRRQFLHQSGARFLGIYQYIVATQDPAMQADAMAALIGKLQPGERIIGDLEEGSGDQKGRWLAWASEIKKLLGQEPWDYSGLNFAADHGLAPVNWVADYTTVEPAVPHRLWQFTDNFSIPGVGKADCSLFHGTMDELAMLGWQDPAFAIQPSVVHANPRWTSIELSWTGGHAPEGYEVYLTPGSDPNQPSVVQEHLSPTAVGYRFGHLKFHHTYTVGVWAKPGAPDASTTWRTVTTR